MLVEQATGNQFVARPSSVFAPVLAPQCSQQRPFLLLVGLLTRGNPTCLRKASLTLPVSAKACLKADLKVAFCYHPGNSTNGVSFYRKFFGPARLSAESAWLIIVGCGGRTKRCRASRALFVNLSASAECHWPGAPSSRD